MHVLGAGVDAERFGVGGEVGLGCLDGWWSDDGLLRGAIVVDKW